jgi:hypothetical protein
MSGANRSGVCATAGLGAHALRKIAARLDTLVIVGAPDREASRQSRFSSNSVVGLTPKLTCKRVKTSECAAFANPQIA